MLGLICEQKIQTENHRKPMMKNNPNLEILVGARKKLGKTQKQVAEETGVKQQFVSAWENGTTLIPKSKAELVANSYGLKL